MCWDSACSGCITHEATVHRQKLACLEFAEFNLLVGMLLLLVSQAMVVNVIFLSMISSTFMYLLVNAGMMQATCYLDSCPSSSG